MSPTGSGGRLAITEMIELIGEIAPRVGEPGIHIDGSLQGGGGFSVTAGCGSGASERVIRYCPGRKLMA